MSDIIKLLPDAVANQIAAGEVIQRPSSAVKELLENAIDAEATNIQLFIKDAGRTLVQVIDNGKGMSETDARMCFERHATSKINEASDLWAIRTMGFRGEALASIAAIARVELKTRNNQSTLGTEIVMEGSQLIEQKQCNCAKGTNIQIKNLFYNTPARRNFLKNDSIEKGHILQELFRVALAYPSIAFSFTNNTELTYQFDKANLKQRISAVFGSAYSQRLVPVEEKTDMVSISGFVVKPEFSKKRRGEQYFFVNNRFIRSSYFNHAVENAFEELISTDLVPGYFLYLEIDPAQIDVNVHPTKTEIKFQDEKYIYQILRAAIKRALGRFNITPTLDFEQETGLGSMIFPKDRPIVAPTTTYNPDFNPFHGQQTASRLHTNLTGRINPAHWEKLFDAPTHPEKATLLPTQLPTTEPPQAISMPWDSSENLPETQKVMQLQRRYILTPVKSGIMLIDQQRAHERILFEGFYKKFETKKLSSQHLLFPENITLSEPDAALLREILEHVRAFGFAIDVLGKNTFVVGAVPPEVVENESLQTMMEGILENYRLNLNDQQTDIATNMARSMARRLAIKSDKTLTDTEMMHLINTLFTCQIPEISPSGKPVLIIVPMNDLTARFK